MLSNNLTLPSPWQRGGYSDFNCLFLSAFLILFSLYFLEEQKGMIICLVSPFLPHPALPLPEGRVSRYQVSFPLYIPYSISTVFSRRTKRDDYLLSFFRLLTLSFFARRGQGEVLGNKFYLNLLLGFG
jgi:hypothetical protein